MHGMCKAADICHAAYGTVRGLSREAQPADFPRLRLFIQKQGEAGTLLSSGGMQLVRAEQLH